MIDNMDQGVLVVDDENRVQFVNQTALKTLGVVQNNIIGKPIRFRPLTLRVILPMDICSILFHGTIKVN